MVSGFSITFVPLYLNSYARIYQKQFLLTLPFTLVLYLLEDFFILGQFFLSYNAHQLWMTLELLVARATTKNFKGCGSFVQNLSHKWGSSPEMRQSLTILTTILLLDRERLPLLSPARCFQLRNEC